MLHVRVFEKNHSQTDDVCLIGVQQVFGTPAAARMNINATAECKVYAYPF